MGDFARAGRRATAPSTYNLADLFEAVADAIPDAEAVVAGDRRLTFAALDERATRLAHVLVDRGVRPGDAVGLHLGNCSEYLEGMLAAFKVRAVPINVNYRYVASELAHVLADARAVALLTEPSARPALGGDCPALGAVLELGESYERALASASPARDFPARSGDDHYVLYTGGTTGAPKGVVWRHEDVFFSALGGGNLGGDPIGSPAELLDHVRPGRRLLPTSPLIHGTAHWLAFATLFAGGCVVLDPSRRLRPDRIWQLVERERVTFLVIVGDAFARPLLNALPVTPRDVSSLSVILSGGAILSPAVRDELAQALPTVMVVDGFGASETGGQGQMVVVAGADPPGAPRFRVGDDTEVLGDDMRPLPRGAGHIGLLARRGRVPLGYLDDPVASAWSFPVVDGVRWAVPGDLATIDADGVVTLLGRGTSSINTGGEKVHPEEVEAHVKSHPAVFDAVVIGVPDPRWGQRVTAIVQARCGRSAPDVDALASHLGGRLAGYKHPRLVIPVDEVVRTASGKPDYRWASAVAADAVAPAADG